MAIIVSTSAVENPGDDPLQWLRDSIPGEPGVDYPIFSAVEQTAFSCDGKVFGGKFFSRFFIITTIIYSIMHDKIFVCKHVNSFWQNISWEHCQNCCPICLTSLMSIKLP